MGRKASILMDINVCIYIYTYTHVRTYVYVCMDGWMDVCMLLYTYIHIYIYMDITVYIELATPVRISGFTRETDKQRVHPITG